jgi:diadenosine tetraphosphate (Ap4A) HIT family hydrolase
MDGGVEIERGQAFKVTNIASGSGDNVHVHVHVHVHGSWCQTPYHTYLPKDAKLSESI